MRALNDVGHALLVEQKQLADHYKDVASFHSRRAKMQKHLSRGTYIIAGMALLANFAQAFTIAALLPLSRIVPVYLWVRPDGTIDSSSSMSQLPPTQSKAVVDASLWQYVRMREGYSYDTAQNNYDAVTEYSAPNVGDQYQKFFNFPNKDSPQVTVGKRGTVTVTHISSADVSPAMQQIRFTKTVAIDGYKPLVTTMTATIGYATVRNLPQNVRLVNPGGILVTSYQVTEDTPK
jgi:type IV secretion system protein VirB8